MAEKRFTKEYFDEYNNEYDFIEKDILTIFDNVSNKKYFMQFLDDDDMNNTIDELINQLNEQEETIQKFKKIMKDVAELLSIEADLFSDKATEHDMNAYIELKELDNKDAYYMAVSIKEAIKILRGDVDD